MSDVITNRLGFEEHIKGMSDRQLLEFTARTSYAQSITIGEICEQVKNKADKKFVNIVAGTVATMILAIIGYVLNHIGFPGAK